MKEQNDNKTEYLAKEVEYLRNTYLGLRKETRDLESYTLLAVSAIWSWLLANSGTTYIAFIEWLPFILVQLFGIRALGVYMQMRTIRKYLKKVETDELLGKLGWEAFLDQDSTRSIWPITATTFWTVLSILSGVVPFLLKLPVK